MKVKAVRDALRRVRAPPDRTGAERSPELELQSDPVLRARVLRLLFQQEELWEGAPGMLEPAGAGRDTALAPFAEAHVRTAGRHH